MTYKNLKKFIKENKNTELNFDLIPKSIKSKIIFSVGEGSHITSTLISSIMSECDIPHSRYIKHDKYELKNRFVRQNESINITELCKTADHLLQKAKRTASNEFLLLLSAIYLFDFEEYLILDISPELLEK